MAKKFVVRGEHQQDISEAYLEQSEDGVYLKVNKWYVACLRNDGVMELISGIADGDHGMQIDCDGYIEIDRGN